MVAIILIWKRVLSFLAKILALVRLCFQNFQIVTGATPNDPKHLYSVSLLFVDTRKCLQTVVACGTLFDMPTCQQACHSRSEHVMRVQVVNHNASCEFFSTFQADWIKSGSQTKTAKWLLSFDDKWWHHFAKQKIVSFEINYFWKSKI